MPASSAYSLPEARAPLVPRAACMVGSSKSLRCAGAEQAHIKSTSGRAGVCFIILSLIIALGWTERPTFGEQVGGSAAWAAVNREQVPPVHQLQVVQPFRRRARAATDADVGPNVHVHRRGQAAEIERPAVNAEARAEEAIGQPREIREQMQRNLRAVANQQETPGTGYLAAVLAIQVRERSNERAGSDVREMSGAFDSVGEFGGGSEGVDVAAAACQPGVQAI